jgi:Ulp1 family protease
MFCKKFIFVPVNGDLHWSLCVIVNPGQIMHVLNENSDEQEENKQEEDEQQDEDKQEKEWPW